MSSSASRPKHPAGVSRSARTLAVTMYHCPSCRAQSITFMRKWLSWSASPARCRTCGKGCAIPIVDASETLAASAVVVTLCGFAAVAVQATYPLVLGLGVAVGYYFWRQHRAQLVPITEAELQTAKRSSWLALLVALFPGTFS